jgi:hypothetical protein
MGRLLFGGTSHTDPRPTAERIAEISDHLWRVTARPLAEVEP